MLDGEAAWKRKAGTANKSCADCHGDAGESMKGVAARYPAFNAARGRPVNLDQQINICRTERQQATPLALESKELLALSAYVARQSRGMPINVTIDERTRPFLEAGRATFFRRQGQLNFACAQCHDDNWRGGSPARRSRRRIRPAIRSIGWNGRASARCSGGCAIASSACGSSPIRWARPNMSISSSILMWRARGMKIEAPAVRP